MRKQPLIALSAFVALGASAIAGAGTSSLNAVPTSARISIPVVQITPLITKQQKSGHARVAKLPPVPRHERNLVVVHDLSRPVHLRLNPITGLPFVHKKHKPKPHVVKAAVAPKPAPVVTQAPAPAPAPPPTTTPPTTVPTTAASGGVWYELRMCESGGDYATNTGNGFYGAYQFALSTWYGLGFTGLPSDAPPAVQDRAAQELQARSGWGQWPACSAKLGL
jgi:hypothetical protein